MNDAHFAPSLGQTLRQAPAPRALVAFIALAALGGCDDKPKATDKPSASATVSSATPPPPASSTPPADKKPTAPQIIVDDTACVIDGVRYEFAQPDPRGRIAGGLAGKVKEGQALEVVIMRDTKAPKVGHVMSGLHKAKVAEIMVHTQKRDGKTGDLSMAIAPARHECSVVAHIGKDNATNVWTLAGGTANRFAKGMAGPDNTLASDGIRKLSEKCDSGVWYVALDESHTWAKAFDLALTAKDGPLKPTQVVYLPDPPVPGRKVADPE